MESLCQNYSNKSCFTKPDIPMLLFYKSTQNQIKYVNLNYYFCLINQIKLDFHPAFIQKTSSLIFTFVDLLLSIVIQFMPFIYIQRRHTIQDCNMIQTLLKTTNVFQLDNFWKFDRKQTYSSICGGLLSIPVLFILLTLLVLKIRQMATYGIVYSNSQINYSFEPPFTTFSTNLNDAGYAPFMLAFSANIDNATCPNSAIAFQAYLNEYTGPYNTANRTLSKVPLNFQACSTDHFGMLPGKMSKLNQWTTNTLYCLPVNSYFQIGGASKISNLYKNIQFRFACPSQCAASTCGYAQFFAVSSTANLGNASSPFSYSLSRNIFSVLAAPKYQVSYQIDSSNMTTDNSLLPFSMNSGIVSASLGSVVTDIPTASGDTINYVTIQKSDKVTTYSRSYYKIFDLFAYIGGIIYALILLLSFIRFFSKIEFEFNFAAAYFRVADSKCINFRGYIKQLVYGIVKSTRWKPNWRQAEERQQAKEAGNRILDVVYLNKRILFLQEAISLIFQKHQLKGIQLLHTLNREEMQSKAGLYYFRDRLVYFLGRKYKHKDHTKLVLKNKNLQSSQSNKSNPGSQEILQERPILQEEEIRYSLDDHSIKEMHENQTPHPTPYMKQSKFHHDQGRVLNEKPIKLTLKSLIQHEGQHIHSSKNLIINEAEKYYSELQSQKLRQSTVVNSREDHQSLQKELRFIGELSSDELDQHQLVKQLQTDMKKLIAEGENDQGYEVSKKIYTKLDEWLKNYLKDTINSRHH